MLDLLITNALLFINNKWEKHHLGIVDERIAYIGDELLDAKEVYDASKYKIIPGLIDPHVHFSLDCGTVTSVDDFVSGSKSAAYGGVTTFIDFLDPARNARTEEKKFYERLPLAKASNVDYHFHGCIKEPDGDLEEFVLKVKALGMKTIKLFTTYSETRRRTYDKDIITLLKLSKKYNILIEAHIENDEMIVHDDSLKCIDISEARNSESETIEALKLAEYAKTTGGNLYMVHCSSGATLSKFVEQYKDILGKNLFVESCPQYFVFDKDILKGENGCLFTFAPPLRSKEEKELLGKNIDYVSCIGTDHCAFMSEDKKSHPLLKGHPLGIGGIESSFLVMHKLFGDKIINKMSKNVAELQGFPQKGEIIVGKDADLVFIEDCEKYALGKPHATSDYSIYEGIELNERIVSTMLRGKFVLKEGNFLGGKGQLLNCKED